MRKVAGKHPFCVLIYMNSHIVHIYFISFILLSLAYLIFDFICLTLSLADTHGIATYARTNIRHIHTHAHTHTQKKSRKTRKKRGGARKERKKKRRKDKKKRGEKKEENERKRGGEKKKQKEKKEGGGWV